MNRDQTYIAALYASDQRGIREAYMVMKRPFIAFVRSHCTHLNEKYLEDVYHEAFLRLQQNVLSGKLTAETLTGSLLGYLQGVGFNVAMEMVRKMQEVVEGSAAWEAMINTLEKQAEEEDEEGRYGMSALWEIEVEEPFSKWCKMHPDSSEEEQFAYFDELTDAFLDRHKGRPSAETKEKRADAMDDVLLKERDQLIRDCVARMKAPCAPLLIGAIWEGKSNFQLTLELGYANEDSTKNQKSRCLRKLKAFIRPILKQYGYDYE